MQNAEIKQKSVSITLPDGSVRTFDAAITGAELAASIGAGLAKAAIAVKVDGVQRDLNLPISENAKVQILTLKDEEGLDIMRHTTTAQVLALAVKQLWPEARLAIGPTIENGFYYDIDLDVSLTPDDLPKIEAKMREIIATGKPVNREMWLRSDAIAMFEARGEFYKAELIRNAPEDDTTEKGKISLYRQGQGEDAFIDLCRGPHVTSLSQISMAFRLTKLSGAYWRGDSKNKMLQRIYGVSFPSEKELKAYLTMMEEAEKRDHRKLGRALDLFHIQEEAVGQVFWHQKGWTLFRVLENYIRAKITRADYGEVKTPMLLDRSLWEQSGHWDKFGAKNMFTSESEERVLALKPMNCPGHIQIFKQGLKSYRDLPLRMAEFGSCHRNEPSGALHGIMRVRGFTQDDAHIFCMESQILSETEKFCLLLQEVYRELGFEEVAVKLSTRPETRAGNDETWDFAEKSLVEAVEAVGLEYQLQPGEGAFYGPKLEFQLKDCIGRTWQCGTLQLDFVLPERLDATYVGEDGNKHRPVMLHRAILGSMERFIGILIENYAGKFPLWLSPVQVAVASITNEFDDYAREVYEILRNAGLRAELDISNNKINYKIREHSNAKVPVILAVGGRERDEKTVSIRRLGSEKQQVMPLSECVVGLIDEAKMPTA